MRFKLDASSAKQASLQSEKDKARANEQHAEHRASIAEMSANDAAAAGSLRELAAKLLDDQEDPSMGATADVGSPQFGIWLMNCWRLQGLGRPKTL